MPVQENQYVEDYYPRNMPTLALQNWIPVLRHYRLTQAHTPKYSVYDLFIF